jgi:DNA-binding response OmpR family regulator
MDTTGNKTKKAVIVEDDQAIQYMYKVKLERSGFDVSTASDGKEGLEVIENFRPDIILLDLMMPIMNGDKMLEALRSKEGGNSIKVVVLTNISKDEAPPLLRILNVDRYIVKAHYTPAQVVDIVNEVLASHKRHGQVNFH